MRVPKKIKDEIKLYCELNNIELIDPFIVEQIVTGFNITKYGNAPFVEEVVVIKEVPVETIKEVIIEKEVPVERVKEIIKEVPVEKEIIKEVIIEKEIFITDDEKVNEMGNQITHLQQTLLEKEQHLLNNSAKHNKLTKQLDSLNITHTRVEGEKKGIEKESNKKDNEIKELKNKIIELEKEMTKHKNDSVSSKGRPIRDIYDDDVTKGGFWGSNLKDKK